MSSFLIRVRGVGLEARDEIRTLLSAGSVRSPASRLASDDKIKNVQAAVMMSSAMRVALAKRKRRREAETVWL